MKKRWLIKALLFVAALALAAYLGAKAALYATSAPSCDLSDIAFSYAVNEEARMPVVEVFFVTSRKLVSEREVTFSSEPSDTLTYGKAFVRIPAGLRIGDIQLPDVPRNAADEKYATISRLELLPEAEFNDALAKRLENSRTIDLLVHGINHSFDSSVRQAGTLTFDLNMPQPMVLFSWPTVPGILPAAYDRDRMQVKAAAASLQDFLEDFQQRHEKASRANYWVVPP